MESRTETETETDLKDKGDESLQPSEACVVVRSCV